MRHPNGLRAASGAVGGWTLANAVYSGVSFSVSLEDNAPQGLFLEVMAPKCTWLDLPRII